MARTKDREKAIALRKKGLSYSQIKNKLSVSKSTLSGWLKDMPLPKSRLDELQRNDLVIEKIRQTKLAKKLKRREGVYKKVSQEIRNSKDPFFVAGFYLYWAEGTKTSEYSVSLANSDPSMIKCFVLWLQSLGVPKDKLKGRLHVYSDQNEPQLRKFWSKQTGISLKNFTKSYSKQSRSDRKTFKGMFPHGTCVIAYHNRDMHEYILEGMRFLQDSYRIDAKTKMR